NRVPSHEETGLVPVSSFSRAACRSGRQFITKCFPASPADSVVAILPAGTCVAGKRLPRLDRAGKPVFPWLSS
ncbi:hypothetical protein, partial [Pseudomonas aeruginosa]|uniref:hypothetical protein n=1 Tax=Pseudomonas aeruginosa TaxID=287 RepID=UPI00193A454B